MTRGEIKAKHKEYADKVQQLKDEIERVRLAWRQLQAECKHPKAYKTSCCGEEGNYCPDCGWS
jgi:hypothetical protein